MEEIDTHKITYIRPFLALDNPKALKARMYREFSKHTDVTKEEISRAIDKAYEEAEKVKSDVRKKGEETLEFLKKNNKIGIVTMANKISKVMVAAKLNSANAMRDVASVAWKVDSDYVEIPEATPINTTVSPEEVKDIAAMYDANQVTKIMSITKTALSEKKDKNIKTFLDESYARLDERTSFAGKFDFAVPEGYALDWVTFRHSTFMD